MGRLNGWASQLTGRPVMRSPGRPPAGRREHRQRFWAAIARGMTSEQAGVEAGVSPAVGVRWFRLGGGMPPITQAPLSGRYLSFAEREEIALLRAQHHGVREIARQIGRSPSTRSHVSCAATRPRVAVVWTIGPRQLSGMPIGALGVQSWRSWPSTHRCVGMCRTASQGWCSGRAGASSRVRRSDGSVVVTAGARTVVGQGVES